MSSAPGDPPLFASASDIADFTRRFLIHTPLLNVNDLDNTDAAEDAEEEIEESVIGLKKRGKSCVLL
jgi:hypothetical protein